jgi:hypothetical protein
VGGGTLQRKDRRFPKQGVTKNKFFISSHFPFFKNNKIANFFKKRTLFFFHRFAFFKHVEKNKRFLKDFEKS